MRSIQKQYRDKSTSNRNAASFAPKLITETPFEHRHPATLVVPLRRPRRPSRRRQQCGITEHKDTRFERRSSLAFPSIPLPKSGRLFQKRRCTLCPSIKLRKELVQHAVAMRKRHGGDYLGDHWPIWLITPSKR